MCPYELPRFMTSYAIHPATVTALRMDCASERQMMQKAAFDTSTPVNVGNHPAASEFAAAAYTSLRASTTPSPPAFEMRSTPNTAGSIGIFQVR